MGYFTGRTGSLTYLGKKIAKIRDWSLNTTVDLLSTNAIDSVVDTFTPGVKRATGSATLIYYRLEAGESTVYTQFTELITKLHKQGAIVDSDLVQLDLNVGGGATDDIVLNAFITSVDFASSTGELSVVPIQFTMQGDFVQTVA